MIQTCSPGSAIHVGTCVAAGLTPSVTNSAIETPRYGPIARAAPLAFDRLGEIDRGLVAPAARAVGADEIRVAEAALRGGTIGLAAGPEIAAGEAAEHRRAPGVRPLPLQGEEDFLDGVAHCGIPAR